MEQRLYTIHDMAGLLGLTVSAIHGHLNRRNYGAVPRPIRLGRRLMWPVAIVDAWIQDKVDAAQAATEEAHQQFTQPVTLGRPRKTRSGH